jgi:hypothetical protein
VTNDWVLALEQDVDLAVAHGSVDEVARAVARGADLHLYMTTATYEETLYFQQTYSGEGDAFAGLMSHHHSYTHEGTIPEQPYVGLFKYDASGTYSHVKWTIGDSWYDASDTYPYGVYRWFVRDRWRVVYEHDSSGARISGDLDELKEHIRSGREIRVGVRQLFGLAREAAGGPAHISFLTTMQPLIESGHVLSNCDFVIVGPPKWPFDWKSGVHLAMMRPSTSGVIECYLTRPGGFPFTRITPRRSMQWLVAETG